MKIVKNFYNKLILYVMAALLPAQSLLVAATSVDSKKQAMVAHILSQIQAAESASQANLATRALGQIDQPIDSNFIMDSAAYRELQMQDLGAKLDKTETQVGSVTFQNSFKPTTDVALIAQRQALAKALLDDGKLHASIQKKLQRIKKSEQSILSYWDEQNALFAQADAFYYDWLKWMFGERVNTNRYALETAMIWQAGSSVWNMLFYLGMQQVLNDFTAAAFFGIPVDNVFDSFKDGIWNTGRVIWLARDLTKNRDGGQSYKEYLRGLDNMARHKAEHDILSRGTMADNFWLMSNNIEMDTTVGFGALGRGIHWTAEKIANIPLIGRLARLNPFDQNGAWNHRTHSLNPDGALAKGFNYGRAGVVVGAITAFKVYGTYEAVSGSWSKLKNVLTVSKKLHIHTIHMAQVIKELKNITVQLSDNPAFVGSPMVKKLSELFAKPSPEMKKLLDLLESDTFATSKAHAQVFSRGNVLLAHRLMTRVYTELTPMLQGLGELDALYAMVTNIKEHAGTDLQFSFAEFTADSQAMVDLEAAWLPLVHSPVANDISFGGGKPNKVILTGPNGGGKSVYLKTLGATIGMIQSWGIAPAKSARVSMFDGIRTSIHPEESLEQELSTFMAEKMRVDDIKEFVFGHNNPNFKVMLLLDEPFRGTVDAESADRIYQFGKELAPLQQSIVLIATHVEKPTHLAADTNNAFTNYHVCITEREDGTFERQFKLEQGRLDWWFNDASKRSKFIDFVTMAKHKEQLAKIKAAKALADAQD